MRIFRRIIVGLSVERFSSSSGLISQRSAIPRVRALWDPQRSGSPPNGKVISAYAYEMRKLNLTAVVLLLELRGHPFTSIAEDIRVSLDAYLASESEISSRSDPFPFVRNTSNIPHTNCADRQST